MQHSSGGLSDHSWCQFVGRKADTPFTPCYSELVDGARRALHTPACIRDVREYDIVASIPMELPRCVPPVCTGFTEAEEDALCEEVD